MATVAQPVPKESDSFKTQKGVRLSTLSEDSPILLVFLRHLGCTFCRETLTDVAGKREFLAERGIQPVFVHMSPETDAVSVFQSYGLEDCHRVSDPDQKLYQAFGLKRGSILQLFGPKVILRGLYAMFFERHGVGKLMGDGMQMPGVFLVHANRIVRDFRHRTAADRPSYETLGKCPNCP